MKKIVMMLILTVAFAFADSSIKMEIGGMTCGGCATGITESFEEDFTKYKVHLDYKSAIMDISTKDGSDVNVTKVESILEEMGFKGKLIKAI